MSDWVQTGIHGIGLLEMAATGPNLRTEGAESQQTCLLQYSSILRKRKPAHRIPARIPKFAIPEEKSTCQKISRTYPTHHSIRTS